jgi:hypothetical protein
VNWFTVLRQHLSDPEYLHVLINPLPVYGLAIATLGLVLALVLRNQRVTIAALVLVFVSAISAWPTYHYGEAGYDRIKAMSDPAGEQWLDEHMARGEKLIWAFYVLAGMAAVGIGAVSKWPRTSAAICVTTLLWAGGTLGIGGYIAYAGGHVRHREFRFEPAPEARAEERHGDHAQPATEQKPPAPMEHAEHQQPQPAEEQAMSEEQKKQLEASRLQLEASRLQLEASRKQLEASGGVSPTGTPGVSPTISPKKENGHDHH